MADLSDPVAILRVSPARRLFATGVQAALGAILILTAASLPDPGPFGTLILVLIGLLSLWQASVLYRATAQGLVLTREGLFLEGGETIALMADVASVDRGTFAFKPSNGFLIRLKAPGPRRWLPGLYWRVGTRIGVGGTTSGKAARDMADVMTILLRDPDAGKPPA